MNEILVEVAKQYLKVRESKVNNIAPEIQEMQKSTWLKPAAWPWCFDEDVETLTYDGWIKIKDLTGDELIATPSQNDGFEWKNIVGVIKNEPTEQEFVYIKNRSIELNCTSNHRFGGYWNSKKYEIKPISDIRTNLSIPLTFHKRGTSEYSDKEIMFIAAFICDGYYHKGFCEFQVSKEKKIKALSEFDVRNIYTSKKIYGLSKLPLTSLNFEIPSYFDKIFTGYKILNQNFINNLTQKQAKLFIDTYNFYDGTKGKSGRKTLSTSREHSIDALTQIAVMAGVKYNISKRISGIKGTEMWIMSHNESHKTVGINKLDVAKYNQNKATYCVETETGLMIVRDKNKNSMVTGNCAAFTCHVLKKALENPEYESYIRSRYEIPTTLENWRCKDASAFGWINWANKLKLSAKHKDEILFDERKTAKCGDIVVFDFSHIGIVENQIPNSGIITTIEGNTSPKTTQRDGVNDGVYQMTRKDTLVKSYIRL